MFIILWILFIANSQEHRARGCLRETVVLYMILLVKLFFWNHYKYGFLKSDRAHKRD